MNKLGLSLWEKQLGLKLHRWSIKFYIKDSSLINNTNLSSLPQLNTEDGSITFSPKEKDNIEFEFTRLKMLMNSKFGKDNFSYETRFEYLYDVGILTKAIEDQIRSSFPSIQFESNYREKTLYFYQEYIDHSKRNQITRSLNDELNQLFSSEISFISFFLNKFLKKFFIFPNIVLSFLSIKSFS